MIIFRTDGNPTIGSGHVMRCLSIAQAFLRKGEQCCFIVADENFSRKIREEGFRVVTLGTDFSRMEEELPALIEVLKAERPTHIVVDSYFATKRYFGALQKSNAQVVYIDDLCEKAFQVDKIVNYNVYADEALYTALYREAGMKRPELFLGVAYAPLRREFANLKPKEQQKACRDILISTGGADPIHLAVRFLKHIKENQHSDSWTYHIVMGAKNQDGNRIEQLAQEIPNVVLHRDVKQMSALMRQCDIAVSAAGSTLYELCACGIPTITYSLANNQKLGMDTFASMGLMQSLGDLRPVEGGPQKILNAIRELAWEYPLREKIAATMCALVDGCGADRIVEKILET